MEQIFVEWKKTNKLNGITLPTDRFGKIEISKVKGKTAVSQEVLDYLEKDYKDKIIVTREESEATPVTEKPKKKTKEK